LGDRVGESPHHYQLLYIYIHIYIYIYISVMFSKDNAKVHLPPLNDPRRENKKRTKDTVLLCTMHTREGRHHMVPPTSTNGAELSWAKPSAHQREATAAAAAAGGGGGGGGAGGSSGAGRALSGARVRRAGAGVLAGVTERLLSHPIETCKVILQNTPASVPAIQALSARLQQRGLASFYVGTLPSVLSVP